MVKNTILLLVLSVGLNAAPDDIILSQAKNPGPGNIQRNLAPVANAAIGVDANKVPVALNAFTQNSATGAVTIAAQGTNQNVTLTPSGTGAALVTFGLTPQAYTYQGLQVAGAINQRTGFMLDAQGTQNPTFLARRARDSAGSPSAVQAGDTLGQYSARGYGATLYAPAQGGFAMIAIDNFTDSIAGQKFSITGIIKGTTTGVTLFNSTDASGLVFGNASTSTGKSISAWGTMGVAENHLSGTFTDTSSSGTVATAVANSFSVPTFAATSATTFTNAANLYIAGDVSSGTNVTLTNSYGLWNAGKTRLDGNVFLPTVGTTINIKQGANGKSGTFTLTAGAATVSNTSITANSVVIMTLKTVGGTVGTQAPMINTITPSTGFTVIAAGTNTSTYNYIILEATP